MILIISCVFPPEPVVSASMAYDLSYSLSEIEEVKVLTPRPSRPFGFNFEEDLGEVKTFEHIVVNSFIYPKSSIFGRMVESYSFGKHAVKFIKKYRSQIKCIYLNVWPILAQYLIINISKRFNIQTINHIQDIYPESLINKIHLFTNIIKNTVLPIDKYILRNSSKVIAISPTMASTFVETRGINSEKIEIIYNWINEYEYLRHRELPSTRGKKKECYKQFTFMYLGNIGPVAGVDFLIRSFSEAHFRGALLAIAGSGSRKKECVKLAESLKDANIKFWNVPSGKVTETLKKADVLILPTKKGAAMSSIPSKLMAYMFSGKPIIACVDTASDTAYSVKQANCGWIIPSENSELLTKAMKTAAAMPESKLQRIGGNGFNYAMKNFSKKNNLQKLVRIIIESSLS